MMTWEMVMPGAQLIVLLLVWRALQELLLTQKQRVPRPLVVPKEHAPLNDTVHFEVDSLFLAALFRYCTSDGTNEVLSFIGGISVGKNRFVLSHLVPVALAKQSPGGATADEASSIRVMELLDCWGTPFCGHVHSHPGHGPQGTRPSETDRRFINQLAAGGHRALGAIVARGHDGHAYVRFYMHDSASFEVSVSGHNVEPVLGERNVYRLINLADRTIPIAVPDSPNS